MIKPGKDKLNEWYTPPEYLEAARKVLETIDVDPASSELANKTVRAATFYTKEQNGLRQPWAGNVWCNPPYTQEYPGHSAIKPWVQKALRCYEDGEITAAILLLPNDTTTQWFAPLWQFPICFPRQRIRFIIAGEKREKPTFGTCFVYLGSHHQLFTDIFSKFGPVVEKRTPSEDLPETLTLWKVQA